jgi:hypothetical protein
MRIYMGWEGPDPAEGAVLIFANNARQAKQLAAGSVIANGEWIDLRVRWLKDSPHLESQKLSDEPHVIDDPEGCQRCEMWGGVLNEDRQGCSFCSDDDFYRY